MGFTFDCNDYRQFELNAVILTEQCYYVLLKRAIIVTPSSSYYHYIKNSKNLGEMMQLLVFIAFLATRTDAVQTFKLLSFKRRFLGHN